MLLHAVIVPPRPAVEAVLGAIRAVPERESVEAAPRRGARLGFGRRASGPQEAAPPAPLLNYPPVEVLRFPVTGFGNLTTADSHRLVEALTQAGESWAPARVRFQGGTALDFPGDWSVWAKVAGDLDPLLAVARGVTRRVEALGLFVDRRAFRPMLSIATVTEATTGPYLESVVAALEAFEGQDWLVDHVCLMTESFVDGRTVGVEYCRIPLGSAG